MWWWDDHPAEQRPINPENIYRILEMLDDTNDTNTDMPSERG